MKYIKIVNYSKLSNITLLLLSLVKKDDRVALFFLNNNSMLKTIIPYLQHMKCKTEILSSNKDIARQLYYINPMIFLTEDLSEETVSQLSIDKFKSMLTIKILNCKTIPILFVSSHFDIIKIEDANTGEESWFRLSHSSQIPKALLRLEQYDSTKISVEQKNIDSC